ncbi:pre-B-cell leukemia homeobox interacting protein 1b isoform X2 [Denticeps clupeoides]|uniref:pre-B-cell leukemia homeobox interacting protein 1b isoform X2 n=1 Tax=Denticeps clupeoides TaxID=299321 RepID=UPI0010A51174|nr:pre-B-cell leukemia transcription factor-interacting protein 1 isoform X2 [Denticeps clupeoides]
MSDNDKSSNGNNWTILTPEAPVAEHVGPMLEDGQGHGDPVDCAGERSKMQPDATECLHLVAEPGAAIAKEQLDSVVSGIAEDRHAEQLLEQPQVFQGTSPEGAEDTHLNDDSTPSVVPLSSVAEGHTPTTTHVYSNFSSSQALPSSDNDTFSDSYTHIHPSNESSTQEEKHHQEVEELGKTESQVEKANEGDGLRRRRVSLLGSLDQHKKDNDDEDEVEDYQAPPQDEDMGLSLNKCIVAAVILLGLGTIFFSGVFLDLDEEGDVDVKDMKISELKLNKEWLKIDRPTDLIDKLEKETQQIAALQAQLQNGQLKSAQQLAEVGEKEKKLREELERENQRIKADLERQKELEQENQKMKMENERSKRDLENMSTLQKEVESLRAKLKHPPVQGDGPKTFEKTSKPPSSHDQRPSKSTDYKDSIESKKEWKKDGKKDEKRDWGQDKIAEKKGKKEWRGKKEETEVERQEERRGHRKEKESLENKQSQKMRGKKEGGEKQKWSEDTWWEKEENGGVHGYKSAKTKEWQDQKDNRGRKREKEWKAWEEENDWRDEAGKHGKEQKMKVGKKERQEKDEWNGKNKWRKDESKERKKQWRTENGEKKWKGEKDDKIRKGKKDWREVEEEEEERERGKGRGRVESKNKRDVGKQRQDIHEKEKKKEKKQKQRPSSDAKEEVSRPRAHHLDNQHEDRDYWTQQRQKLRHFHAPPGQCGGAAACAQAQGLVPVSLADFEGLLLQYLSRLEGVGELASRKEELSTLVREFFADGVFSHNQMPFSEFVEDVSDILEDMAEEEENRDVEEEMEGFEREALERFALPHAEAGDKEERRWAAWKNRASA